MGETFDEVVTAKVYGVGIAQLAGMRRQLSLFIFCESVEKRQVGN